MNDPNWISYYGDNAPPNAKFLRNTLVSAKFHNDVLDAANKHKNDNSNFTITPELIAAGMLQEKPNNFNGTDDGGNGYYNTHSLVDKMLQDNNLGDAMHYYRNTGLEYPGYAQLLINQNHYKDINDLLNNESNLDNKYNNVENKLKEYNSTSPAEIFAQKLMQIKKLNDMNPGMKKGNRDGQGGRLTSDYATRINAAAQILKDKNVFSHYIGQ